MERVEPDDELHRAALLSEPRLRVTTPVALVAAYRSPRCHRACRWRRGFVDDENVLALTDVDPPSLDETKNLVSSSGVPVCSTVTDLMDTQEISALFAFVHHSAGPISVLVNNAAIYPLTPFLKVPFRNAAASQPVNQRGYWICAQMAARDMRKAGRGAIVNVASITMHGGWPGLAAYVTTKGGAVALTRALARELGACEFRLTPSRPAPSRPKRSKFTMTQRPITRT